MEALQETPSNNGEKTADGRFAKGNSYGQGRPQGSRNKTSLMVESLLASKAEDITHKIIEMALKGDMTALRICMERLLPPNKERPIQFNMPEIKSMDDAAMAMRAIRSGMEEGALTLPECRLLLSILECSCTIVVDHELEKKVNEMRQKAGKNTGQKMRRH